MSTPDPNQRIHQIQVSHIAEEDRLLLRINTNHLEEFRFWLTRRFVKRFWPAMSQALKNHPKIAMSTTPETRNAVLDFMQEKASATADFTTAFQGHPTVTPLGPKPVLVGQARLRATDGINFLLSLHPSKGFGIEVAMDPHLLLSFRQLLADAIRQADWDLGPANPPPEKDPLAAPPPPTPPKGPQLH